MEELLLQTFRGTQPSADEDLKSKASEAAVRIRELRKGVVLGLPEGVSLREYAHIGHRY